MSIRTRRWKNANGQICERRFVDILFAHSDGHVERVRKRCPVNTLRGAEQYEREIRLALLEGRYGKDEKPAKVVPTFAAFSEKFLVYSRVNNKHSTVVSKRQALRDHLLPCFGPKRLNEITSYDVEEFKDQKLDANLSPKTINNLLTVFRHLMAIAEEWKEISQVPKVKWLPTEAAAVDFLSFDEADRLLAGAEVEWRTTLMVALKTGLRIGEIMGLKWEDLDLVAGRLIVRRNIWRGHTNTPKGGRTREIPLSDSLLAALKSHRHLKGPYVFCNEKGQPLTAGELKWPLRRALKKAGIARDVGRIGWHDLRHTFASHLVMRGVPLKVVQELLGHATIEMTMRYAHLSPDVKKDAVKLLDGPIQLPQKLRDEGNQ